jgi:enoyl-CoA hydratase
MSFLLIEKNKTTATLQINRPEALNALNLDVLNEMLLTLQSLKESSIKSLIITGVGPKAFVAGADIKAMVDMEPLDMLNFCSLGQKVSLELETAPFLTIAAINGFALGGGLEIALACDFIYASRLAKMGLPEIKLGIIPGFGGTQRLSRAVGTRRAKEMILTGQMISAEEAKDWGLVNQITEPDDLLPSCIKVAEQVASYSLTAIRQAKNAVNVGSSLNLSDALELEKNLCAVCFSTPERKEGMQAFINKKGS